MEPSDFNHGEGVSEDPVLEVAGKNLFLNQKQYLKIFITTISKTIKALLGLFLIILKFYYLILPVLLLLKFLFSFFSISFNPRSAITFKWFSKDFKISSGKL